MLYEITKNDLIQISMHSRSTFSNCKNKQASKQTVFMSSQVGYTSSSWKSWGCGQTLLLSHADLYIDCCPMSKSEFFSCPEIFSSTILINIVPFTLQSAPKSKTGVRCLVCLKSFVFLVLFSLLSTVRSILTTFSCSISLWLEKSLEMQVHNFFKRKKTYQKRKTKSRETSNTITNPKQ